MTDVPLNEIITGWYDKREEDLRFLLIPFSEVQNKDYFLQAKKLIAESRKSKGIKEWFVTEIVLNKKEFKEIVAQQTIKKI